MPRVSRQSRVLDEKDGYEMIPGAVHRSLGIYLTAEKKPGKLQLGDRLMKALRPVIVSFGVAYLRMMSVGSRITSGREKEGKE